MRYEETRSQVQTLMRSEDPAAAFEAERVLRAWLSESDGDVLDRADALTRLSEVLCRSGRPLLAFPELERATQLATSAFSQLYLWNVEALCAYRAKDCRRAKKLLDKAQALYRRWPDVAPQYEPWMYKWESALHVLLGEAEEAVTAADRSLEAAERLHTGHPEAYSAKAEAHSLRGDKEEAFLYANLAVSVSSGRCRYEALVQLLLIASKFGETRMLDGIARQLRDTAPHPYQDARAAFAKVVDDLILIDPLQARQFLSHFIEGRAS